jgi:hypothetical protein
MKRLLLCLLFVLGLFLAGCEDWDVHEHHEHHDDHEYDEHV